MNPIDFRSDTVTHPTQAMRRAMAEAEVGDDVFGDDPTVLRLEKEAAARVGKAAALFVPSGTMGNLLALLVHCPRGAGIIVGQSAHIFLSEAAGASVVGGIGYRTLPNRADGTLDVREIEAAIRPLDVHCPPTALICLENTHNREGGVPLPMGYVDEVAEVARRHGLPIHLDGARLFNAAVAQKVSAAELTRSVDTVMFCLSKGLSAPVGSLLCGPEALMTKARFARKMLGGGMRQAGILAAAGLLALHDMTDRLAEDHARATDLRRRLTDIPGFTVQQPPVGTNMVFAQVNERAARWVQEGAEKGVLLYAMGAHTLRMVTHRGIGDADIAEAAERMKAVGAALR